jgi:hypothetical protein
MATYHGLSAYSSNLDLIEEKYSWPSWSGYVAKNKISGLQLKQ